MTTNTRTSFEIFRGKDRKWYFRIQAANGEIVAQSEGYERRAGCENGIRAVINAVANGVTQEGEALVTDLSALPEGKAAVVRLLIVDYGG